MLSSPMTKGEVRRGSRANFGGVCFGAPAGPIRVVVLQRYVAAGGTEPSLTFSPACTCWRTFSSM
jgi:hypothetical protein